MKKVIVLDTETTNSLDDPFTYDIGWAVTDRKGNIYETKSFVIYEIFVGMRDVMRSAYYAEKIPRYWEDIKSGPQTCKAFHYPQKFNCRLQGLRNRRNLRTQCKI